MPAAAPRRHRCIQAKVDLGLDGADRAIQRAISAPHMEGTGRQVRFMRFASVEQVEALEGELSAVVRAWCAFAEAG